VVHVAGAAIFEPSIGQPHQQFKTRVVSEDDRLFWQFERKIDKLRPRHHEI